MDNRLAGPADTINLDAEIDRAFGEAVVLRPMKTSDNGYRDAVPDSSRQPVVGVGIYYQTRGGNEETGMGFHHRQAIVDTQLSIRHESVDRCQLTKGDRVYFPMRDETYEVTFIYTEPGGRPDVHLVRVLE